MSLMLWCTAQAATTTTEVPGGEPRSISAHTVVRGPVQVPGETDAGSESAGPKLDEGEEAGAPDVGELREATQPPQDGEAVGVDENLPEKAAQPNRRTGIGSRRTALEALGRAVAAGALAAYLWRRGREVRDRAEIYLLEFQTEEGSRMRRDSGLYQGAAVALILSQAKWLYDRWREHRTAASPSPSRGLVAADERQRARSAVAGTEGAATAEDEKVSSSKARASCKTAPLKKRGRRREILGLVALAVSSWLLGKFVASRLPDSPRHPGYQRYGPVRHAGDVLRGLGVFAGLVAAARGLF